jgi:bifunctional pyridoxal-dependent enzyme with beta-cystathionase and maltose regulon repressor activities
MQEQTWEAEDDLKEQLHNHGVDMSSGRAYHDEKPGRFRLIFAIDKDSLVEALRRYVHVWSHLHTMLKR